MTARRSLQAHPERSAADHGGYFHVRWITISSLSWTMVKRYGLRAGIWLVAFGGTGAVVMLCGTTAPITGLKPVGAATFKKKDGIVRSCQAVFC